MGRNQLGAQRDEICPRCEEPIPGGDQMKHTKQNQASWRDPGDGHLVLWREDRGVGGFLREVSLTWVTKGLVTTDPEERAVDSGWNGLEQGP